MADTVQKLHGIQLCEGINVRCAQDPVFFASKDGNPKRHHVKVSVITSQGLKTAPKTCVKVLDFFGKMAINAAQLLKKGQELSYRGVENYRNVATGEIGANGKQRYDTTNTCVVTWFEVGKESFKAQCERVNGRIQALKAAGRIPATVNITAEELLAIERPAWLSEYNPQAALTAGGKFGNAKVYSGNGWLTAANAVAPQPVAAAAPAGTIDPGIMAQIQSLIAGAATSPTPVPAPEAAAATTEVAVDPFAS